MAKDDYFVIAYKILKYLYECLKKGLTPNLEVLSAEYFSIGKSYWDYIIDNLYEDEYITGVMVFSSCTKVTESTTITPKGIAYLEENSMFKKIKGTLKDVRDMLPL